MFYKSSTIDFALCLGATASEKLANRTKVKSGQTSQPLDKKDEVVANVIWRFLELRGYVCFRQILLTRLELTAALGDVSDLTSSRFLLNTHGHSPLARAMYVAIKPARLVDKFQDSLYLFLELVRAGVMHGHLWSGRAFSGGPSFGTGETGYFPRIAATHR